MSLIPKIRNSQSNLNSIYLQFFLNKVKTFRTLSAAAERIDDYQSQSTNGGSEGGGGTIGTAGFNTRTAAYRGNFNEFVQNNPNRFNQIELQKTPKSLNSQSSYSNLHSGQVQNTKFSDCNLRGSEQNLNGHYREQLHNPASNGSFYREQLQNANGYHQQVMNVNHGQFQQNSMQDHQQVISVNDGQFQQKFNEYNKEKDVWGFQQNQIGFHSELDSVHSRSSVNCVESESEVKCDGTLEEMDGFCNAGNVEEAMRVLNLLHEQGIEIDLPRYCQLMKVIGEVVAKEEAKLIHNHLMKTKLSLEIRVQNKVLEMYLKCGLMSDAHDLFGKIPARNLTSWDTMIVGLAENGYGEDAIEVFTEFKKAGGRPDGQMFLGVFYACSTLCDTNEGMLHFESMSKVYGITPSMDHYVGVVKMLGSTGNIDEAFEFIENMPVEPSIDVWETLMNLCRIHGNLETGDLCSNIIALLDPSRLNVESKAGLVPVNPSDQVIAEKKKKPPGQNVTMYFAGDKSHADSVKIYNHLNMLSAHMKEAGYIPEVRCSLHDVDDESKATGLLAHSEKLACVSAFLNTPARSQIRIMKNLRVCVDCHNALMIITKIVGRKIIARDSKRFHHFAEGACSCNGFW